MPRKKKEELNKKPDPVQLIERIPNQNVDLEKLASFCDDQIKAIRSDRREWEERRLKYAELIDNLIDFDMGEPPYEGASSLHIPITLEKQRATHARLFQALFSIEPPFYIEPQEKIDNQRLKRIEMLMKWALSRFVNYYQGIKDVMDDAIWDFSAEGWCFLRARWDRKMRKSLVIEEEITKPEKQPDKAKVEQDGSVALNPRLKFKEVYKWETVFDGPVVESISKEKVYIPGSYDIQEAPLVAIEMTMSGHELRFGAMTGWSDPEAVDAVLEHKKSASGNTYNTSTSLQSLQGLWQGVSIVNKEAERQDHDGLSDEYTVYECYCTYDIDGDGFDEELVVWYSEAARKVIRWTYLDRITKTRRRPIYKADYIRRPGRQYSIGLEELLYNINMEVNIIHNQRVDYGTIANMPFFFFDSSSGLPNSPISLKPGQGMPVDNVSGLFFPQLKNGTAFGFQEENLLYTISSRVSGISDVNLGIAPTPGDAVRSQGQLAALLSEGNAQLDIALRRLQRMIGLLYSDIHQMLVDKLPTQFEHLIVGHEGDVKLDEKTGLPMEQKFKDTQLEIAGRVHFNIKTNAAAGNKPLMKQTRVEALQVIANPLAMQLGIVTPTNLYEAYRAFLEASDELDIDRFITRPQDAPRALSLLEEIAYIRQGLVPEIAMNDPEHIQKAQAIGAWIQSPQVQEGLRLGNVNPNAVLQAQVTIQKHTQMAQLLEMQQQQLMMAQGMDMKAMAQQEQAAPQEAGGPQQPPQQQQQPNQVQQGRANNGTPNTAGAPTS